MQIYGLFKHTPDYRVVNENGDRIGGPPEELCDLFSNQEAADIAKEKATQQTLHDAEEFGCDPEIFTVKELTVYDSPYQ